MLHVLTAIQTVKGIWGKIGWKRFGQRSQFKIREKAMDDEKDFKEAFPPGK